MVELKSVGLLFELRKAASGDCAFSWQQFVSSRNLDLRRNTTDSKSPFLRDNSWNVVVPEKFDQCYSGTRLVTMSPLYPCGKPCSTKEHRETRNPDHT